jgi:hypothetical protein
MPALRTNQKTTWTAVYEWAQGEVVAKAHIEQVTVLETVPEDPAVPAPAASTMRRVVTVAPVR